VHGLAFCLCRFFIHRLHCHILHPNLRGIVLNLSSSNPNYDLWSILKQAILNLSASSFSSFSC